MECEKKEDPILNLILSVPNIYTVFSPSRNVYQTKEVKREKPSFL